VRVHACVCVRERVYEYHVSVYTVGVYVLHLCFVLCSVHWVCCVSGWKGCVHVGLGFRV